MGGKAIFLARAGGVGSESGAMAHQEWQDLGDASLGAELLPWLIEPTNGTQFRNLHNNRTGQNVIVYIWPQQTLSEAIANQQFRQIEERAP